MDIKQQFCRLSQKIGRSLLQKITISIFLFSVILISCNIIGISVIAKEVLEDYFGTQLHEKIQAQNDINKKALMTLNSFVAQMPIVFPELGQKIAEEDFDYIIQTAKQTSTLIDNDGYVITDAKGNIAYNSYDTECSDIQMSNFKQFIKWLCKKEDLTYNGYVDFLDQDVCLVTAHALPDITTGEVKGTFIVVYARLNNNDYLKNNANMLQLSGNTTYKDNKIVGSSVFAGQKTIHLDMAQTWITDTIVQKQKDVLTVEDYGADTYFSAYSPILGYDDEVVCIYNAAMDISVMVYIIKVVIIALIIIALLVGGLLLWGVIRFFRNNMTDPILSLTETAQRIAQGDLTEEIQIKHTRDEIEKLSISMKEMQKSLSDTISTIAQTSTFLQASSSGLSKASLQLSDGANKQASALEQISSSLEEMAGNIHQNKDNANITEKQMEAADKAVQSIANSASDSMNDTQKIATSIRAINDLVSQTNILSLNASVEAARAGNMGKGFAVVAKEVGRLAEQTKITAYDISEKAEKSIIGTQNINALLDQVTPQLHSVSALIKEITVSSQEQSIGADQINIAIADLNKVTQESAVNANGIANNAQELSSMADKMNQIVGTFKLAV